MCKKHIIFWHKILPTARKCTWNHVRIINGLRQYNERWTRDTFSKNFTSIFVKIIVFIQFRCDMSLYIIKTSAHKHNEIWNEQSIFKPVQKRWKMLCACSARGSSQVEFRSTALWKKVCIVSFQLLLLLPDWKFILFKVAALHRWKFEFERMRSMKYLIFQNVKGGTYQHFRRLL